MRPIRCARALVAATLLLSLFRPVPAAEQTARGVVFEDRNGNERLDSGDRPMEHVRVSKGVDVVETDGRGRYALPVSKDTIFLFIKPRE